MTASSERAFIYSDENFAHRMVVVAEAAGLHSDGIGGTIIRELAWGNRLAYEVVKKTANGLRPRKIVKDGPTGLVTTSVRGVEGELATRLLMLELADDPRQTRRVLEAEALEAMGKIHTPDLDQFTDIMPIVNRRGLLKVNS
ncbi:hypothetical protein SDD30_14910 [Moorella naiadis]|uniref:hypothetical protein n=1 Tax=Moorella naiadis (nom. illeg.) TaxID=3093670 RepID=UPI003D9C7C6B